MAWNVGDIIELVIEGRFDGETMKNVFTYQISVSPPTLLEQKESLQECAFELCQFASNIQHVGASWTGMIANNLTNGLDEHSHTFPTAIPGLVSGSDSMPTFVCFRASMLRATKLTRNGRKSIGGVAEGYIDGNKVEPSLIANVESVFDFWAGPVQDPPAPTIPNMLLVPVIVGRTRIIVDDKEYYVYDLNKINPIVGRGTVFVSTQNSRKLGRGN